MNRLGVTGKSSNTSGSWKDEQFDRAYSVIEAASILGLSPWTIRAWIQRGRIVSIKLGARRMVQASEIQRLLSGGTAS